MTNKQHNKFDEATAWNNLEGVGMEFLDNAKVKLVVATVTSLPRQEVWDAFVDAGTWQSWFPKVECAFYLGDAPYDVGTIRRSIVDGVLYDETMLVWKEPCRWGYRIDRATFAMSEAHLEITEFQAIEAGTRVIWTLAFDPLYDIDEKDFGGFLKDLLKEAIQGLEKIAK